MLERGTARKVAVIALVIMTIALAAVGVVILFQIQSQQDPTDSFAYGFGSSAVRTNFTNVELAFFNLPCEFYLNKTYLTNTGLPELDQLGAKYSHGRDRFLEYENDYAKSCFYYFKDSAGGDKIIAFHLKAYKQDSVIDDSQDALFNRINGGSVTILDQGRYEPAVNYFYGNAKDLTDICRSNVFHDQNDFEYATVMYSGFRNCAELLEMNKLISSVLADRISEVMRPFLVEVGDVEVLQ